MEVCSFEDRLRYRLLTVAECFDFLRGSRAAGSSREDDYQLKFIRVDRSSGLGVIGGGDEGHGRGKTPSRIRTGPELFFTPNHVWTCQIWAS